jgi:hypothetical protein
MNVLQTGDRFICISKDYGEYPEDNFWPEKTDTIRANATLEALNELGLTHFIEIPNEYICEGYDAARIYTEKEISMKEAIEWYNVAQMYEYRVMGGFGNANEVLKKVKGQDIVTDYKGVPYLAPPLLTVKGE